MKKILNDLVIQARANSRLRIGLWLIVAITWGYGLLELEQYNSNLEKTANTIGQRLARAEAQSKEREWLERQEQARKRLYDYEALLWAGQTQNLALAAVQNRLVDVMAMVGSIQPQISAEIVDVKSPPPRADSDSAPKLPADIGLIRAKISFNFAPGAYYRFLSTLYQTPQNLVIESAFIRGMPTPRAELTILAYYKLTAAPKGATEKK